MPSIRQRFHLSPCSDFRSHFLAPTGQEAGDSGAGGTRAFDPERTNLSQAPGPPFELPIPVCGSQRVKLAESDTLAINGHRHMFALVCVDPDDQLNTTTTFMTDDSCHFYLPEDCAPAR